VKRFLSRADYEAAAEKLACETEAVIAISVVEGADRGAFDDEGFPTVLFERHLFHRFTGGSWDALIPGLSAADAGGYGSYREQKTRLAQASRYDREAALRATSWGLFQILGDNWRSAGAESLQGFVNGMCSGVEYHLTALVHFILTSPAMTSALRDKRWATFAFHYNGPRFEQNKYDQHLRQAYELAIDRARREA